MKRALIIYILFLVSCSLQSPKKKTDCINHSSEKINLKELSVLLVGEWKYQYSFVNDTCFTLNKLGDLSSYYSFKKEDLNIIASKYPKLYSYGKDKLLFGLVSSHEDKPFGKTTYPLINSIRNDSTTVRITHYVEGNGVGKGYSYFLEKANKSSLVIRNERTYIVGNKKVTGVFHIYEKTIH